jgi:hypothetical protein
MFGKKNKVRKYQVVEGSLQYIGETVFHSSGIFSTSLYVSLYSP